MTVSWIPGFQTWSKYVCFKNEELLCRFDLDIYLDHFERVISRVLLAK